MNNSMRVPLTSISQPSDRERQLAGTVVPAASVSLGDRREMYALLRAYFSGTTRGHFEADLREKEAVILLRDVDSGRIHGFSTFMRMTLPFDGTPRRRVLFGRHHRGSRVLGRDDPEPAVGRDDFRRGRRRPRDGPGLARVLVPDLLRIQDVALPAGLLSCVPSTSGNADTRVDAAADRYTRRGQVRRRISGRSRDRPVPAAHSPSSRDRRNHRGTPAGSANRVLRAHESRPRGGGRACLSRRALTREPDSGRTADDWERH